MSVLALYLNQTAKLERFVKTDSYGNPTFEDPVTIKVRNQTKKELFRDEHGMMRLSTNVYYTQEKVTASDRIDGLHISGVNSMVDLNGQVVGYKVII